VSRAKVKIATFVNLAVQFTIAGITASELPVRVVKYSSTQQRRPDPTTRQVTPEFWPRGPQLHATRAAGTCRGRVNPCCTSSHRISAPAHPLRQRSAGSRAPTRCVIDTRSTDNMAGVGTPISSDFDKGGCSKAAIIGSLFRRSLPQGGRLRFRAPLPSLPPPLGFKLCSHLCAAHAGIEPRNYDACP